MIFVLLSRWQLESSADSQIVYDPDKEIVRPLTETVRPGETSTVEVADSAVEAGGTYLQDSTVLIENRLQDGRNGWWVVSALQVPGTQQQWQGADADAAMPVVRGWTDDPQEIPDEPAEEVVVVGRFLPQEAPVSTEDRQPGRLGSLSPAQLSNVWDLPVYSGFVTAAGENPAQAGPRIDADGTLPDGTRIMSPQLEAVSVDQQPTDTSVDWLNIFYAIEWVVFAGFALWIWFSTVRDDYRRRQDPGSWFELEGESLAYSWDEQARRYYYFDPVAGEYYYFDDEPGHDEPARDPAGRGEHAGPGGPENHGGRMSPQSGEHR